MKLNFDFEKYRENLAEDLVKTRQNEGKEVAYKKLQEKRETEEYQYAEKRRKEIINPEFINTPEEMKIHQEMIEQYGFQVKDISDKIPTEFKIFFDKVKSGYYDEVIKRDHEYVDPYYGRRTPKEEWTPIQRLYMEHSDMMIKSKISEVFNKVSEGKFSNPKNLIHSFYGYGYGPEFLINRLKEKSQALIDPIFLNDIDFKKMHGDGIGAPTERMFFSSGGTSTYLSPYKELAIFSKKNPNFENFLIIEMVLSAQSDGIDLPPNYVVDVNTILENKYNIIDILLNNKKIQDEIEYSFNDRYTSLSTEEYKKFKNDPQFEAYYAFFTSCRASSLLYLLDKRIIIDNEEGMVFRKDKEALELLKEYLGKKSIKFIDLADTVIDLANQKIYEYVEKEKL